jgi:hypothetical protein
VRSCSLCIYLFIYLFIYLLTTNLPADRIRSADPECLADKERMVDQAVIFDGSWVALGRELRIWLRKVIFDAGLLALSSQNPRRPGKIIVVRLIIFYIY